MSGIITPEFDRRTVLKGGAAAAAGALLLPHGAKAQATPKKGGTLRVAMPYNPASLDPMTGRNGPDFNSLLAIYDPLIDIEPKTLLPKPGLAKFEYKDSKTLVLNIIPGITFHDGTPLDAEAVKFNLDRFKNDPRAGYKTDLSTMDSAEVTGKQQVTMHLTRPNASMTTILSGRAGMMVSPTQIKAAPNGNVDRGAAGTGPFKVVSFADNEKIKTVRNPNYWKSGQPYLDGIDFNIITELAALLRSCSAGEQDMGLNLTVDQKDLVDKNPDLVPILVPSTYFYGTYLNYGAGRPLADVKVRQALSWAIDRPVLAKVLANNLNEAGDGILPSGHWATDKKTFNYYTYDPDKAKKLLADAGHPNGVDIEFTGWSDQTSMRRQELIINQMAAAGIRVKLTPGSPQDTNKAFFIDKKYEGRMSGAGGFADPSQQYDALFSQNGVFNAGKMETPGFADLLAASQATSDIAQRKEVFVKLQQLVLDQALVQTQMFITNLFVSTKKVNGFEVDLIANPRWQGVWLS